MKDDTALQHAVSEAPSAIPASFTLEPQTLTEAIEFAKLIASSELCPKAYRLKPADVLIAVQMGRELGIMPMQALQNIAVINGRPTMWGDLVLGLVQASGKLEAIDERDAQEALKVKEGRCEVRRRGVEAPFVRTFTMEMAQTAGLVARSGSDGPWTKYAGRMLQMRARSWALRDGFADVLKGLQSREEVEDYPDGEKPIRTPRRASEVSPGEVTKFLAEGQGPVAPPAQPGAVSASSGPAGRTTWTGKIVSLDSKSGTSKAGKPYTIYVVKGDDGTEFKTFDRKSYDFAKEAGASPVSIVWETTPRGTKDIVGIFPATEQREPGDEAPDA